MKQLVIGNGEIGSSIAKYLGLPVCDVEGASGEFSVLHICFPFSDKFSVLVEEYKERYKADLVIIHSTVPPGTCRQLGDWVVHSPCRGRHPNLESSMSEFVKYFSGPRANEASELWRGDSKVVEKWETTELGKVLSTEYYRWVIKFNKEAMRLCNKHGADFDVAYKDFNKTYNEGYARMGESQFVRPILEYMEGPIGGHCVEPNHKLLYGE